jgi:hypothetical protein
VAVDDFLKKHGREPIAGVILSEDPNFDPHAEEETQAVAAENCHLHE